MGFPVSRDARRAKPHSKSPPQESLSFSTRTGISLLKKNNTTLKHSLSIVNDAFFSPLLKLHGYIRRQQSRILSTQISKILQWGIISHEYKKVNTSEKSNFSLADLQGCHERRLYPAPETDGQKSQPSPTL